MTLYLFSQVKRFIHHCSILEAATVKAAETGVFSGNMFSHTHTQPFNGLNDFFSALKTSLKMSALCCSFCW